MSPQAVPSTGSTRSGVNLDAEIEAGIAGTRARNKVELLGMAAPGLDNNPVNPIYQPSVSRTPDEVRAAEAIASSPIEEVVVTAPMRSMGDDVIYRHAMNRGFLLPRATHSASSPLSYRDGFVQRAGVLSDTFHVSPELWCSILWRRAGSLLCWRISSPWTNWSAGVFHAARGCSDY